MPASWWVKTWQWYSQRPGLSSTNRAVTTSLGPNAGLSVGAPAGSFDCIVIVTDHSRFNYDDMQRAAKVVVDTRNAIKSPGPHVLRLGAPRPAGQETPLPV